MAECAADVQWRVPVQVWGIDCCLESPDAVQSPHSSMHGCGVATQDKRVQLLHGLLAHRLARAVPGMPAGSLVALVQAWMRHMLAVHYNVRYRMLTSGKSLKPTAKIGFAAGLEQHFPHPDKLVIT